MAAVLHFRLARSVLFDWSEADHMNAINENWKMSLVMLAACVAALVALETRAGRPLAAAVAQVEATRAPPVQQEQPVSNEIADFPQLE
jgi:hypothetical protein